MVLSIFGMCLSTLDNKIWKLPSRKSSPQGLLDVSMLRSNQHSRELSLVGVAHSADWDTHPFPSGSFHPHKELTQACLDHWSSQDDHTHMVPWESSVLLGPQKTTVPSDFPRAGGIHSSTPQTSFHLPRCPLRWWEWQTQRWLWCTGPPRHPVHDGCPSLTLCCLS